MLIRFLTISALAFTLVACSTTDDQASEDEMIVSEREDITTGPLDGTEVYTEDYVETETFPPGSQEDLAVNVGDRVFYGYDRYDLTAEARSTLDRQAEWLMRYPSVNVTIEGHADERGTREYNLALGERRAASVKNYLITMGIDPRRINIISYGKERPAVLGSNPAAWAQNRRGVTRID